MKAIRKALIASALLPTYFVARWWLTTPYSETAWSWINAHLANGQNPGFASDIELLATLFASFAVTAAGFWLLRTFTVWLRQK